MKKVILIGMLLGATFSAGFILGDHSWKRLLFMEGPLVYTPPRFYTKTNVRLHEIPDYGSEVFCFQTGFGEVNQYVSFRLPPELAESFVRTYVEECGFPTNTVKTAEIPPWVLGQTAMEEWNPEYWFPSYDALDQVYYQEHLFCGYSKKKNRIYLMGWNN